MNFYHSFWSAPLLCNKFDLFDTSLATLLLDYAYSAMLVKNNGYKIYLVTDPLGAEILSHVPYDEVIVSKNTITNNYHFAASMKFIALEKMNLGDILIDGDAFFKKGRVYAEVEKCQADVLTALYEDEELLNRFDKNIRLIETVRKILEIQPQIQENIEGWYNTSVMRFNNQELKDKYINLYKRNVDICLNMNFGELWPDIILEQWHLTQIVKDYSILTLVPRINEECNQYALEIGFTHLGAKKSLYNERFFEELKKLSPEIDPIEQFNKIKLTYGK